MRAFILSLIVAGLGMTTGPAPAEAPAPILAEMIAKDLLVVDVDRSIIHWEGTKFWGTRSHSGNVRLAEGTIVVHEQSIVAGRFVLDMTTIEVTDIPKSDPVPRRRLREHLMNEDFFHVDEYPTATFDITEARQIEPNTYRIDGQLTMRGRTNRISFNAHIPLLNAEALRATATFSIDRQEWGVAYRGSRLTNDLVDDEIVLDLVLVADRAQDAG